MAREVISEMIPSEVIIALGTSVHTFPQYVWIHNGEEYRISFRFTGRKGDSPCNYEIEEPDVAFAGSCGHIYCPVLT